MKFTFFYHSVVSCWNNPTAHMLRGICRALIARGHEVSVWEPMDGWSRANAMLDGGVFALRSAERLVPGLDIRPYWPETLNLDTALQGADVVIVQDWNAPELIAAIGARRVAGGAFTLLFHDTLHRTAGALDQFERLEIHGYDGVLACGEKLREVYLTKGWGQQVSTWHAAADTGLFRPVEGQKKAMDLVWMGNWSEGERSLKLREFLLEPIAQLGLYARMHGTRYPAEVQADLVARGIDYAGWLPNHRAPAAFASALFTVDMPPRASVTALPGMPSLRMFEALSCGIPLVSTPWDDAAGLFPEGCYITARNGAEMTAAFASLDHDPDLRETLIGNGLAVICARHSCAHRVGDLIAIVDRLRGPVGAPQNSKATAAPRLDMAL